MKKKIILFTTMAALALASGCGNQQSAKDKKMKQKQ